MLRYSANENAIRNALSQSLSFSAPLDKGNEGSGNEIVSEINIQTDHMLKIPTGGRQTSWLFTERGLGFENGATVKQIQVVRAGVELGQPRSQGLALWDVKRRDPGNEVGTRDQQILQVRLP